jgi:hypothetical protein
MDPILTDSVFTIRYFFVIIFQEAWSNLRCLRQMSNLANFPSLESFWLAMVLATAISGCTTVDGPLNITLHNPKTGVQRTCSAKESSAADISMLSTAVESCAKQLEARGFVRSDSR